jgi:type IV pilus assembly protein PilY1
MTIPLASKSLLAVPSLLLATAAAAAPAFTPDSQPTGWLMPPALTSFSLKSGTELFFRPDYNRDGWSGDLWANDISSGAVVQTTGPWDNADPTLTTAATLLDAATFDTSRKIVTRNTSGANIAFRWANLSSTQQTDIGDATLGPKIVDYIRGDRSNEEPAGESFRARNHVLADPQHSSLIYWEHDANTRRLYLGANDGMLHVFNADDGAELFAYIPSMLIPKLNKLVAKPYVHTHFVDGPLNIANVDFSGSVKTILAGGLGAGGKGLYALDITTPTAASETAAAAKIKWEIDPGTTGFADLGYTYGRPKIARLENGTAIAIAGNGYVNGGNGHAVLYVINLDSGALIAAIDTGSGSTASPNGLSTPSLVDTDGNGRVEYAYAGDIDGQLWKFDLANNTASLLFTSSPQQAITVAPVIFPHPDSGLLVAFTTGRILTSGDLTDNAVHYVYGIWDGAPADNDQLLTQTLTAGSFGNGAIRTITDNQPDWSAGSGHHKGWKVALPAGERAVGETPFFNNLRYYFLGSNPTIVNQQPPNGENWLNEFNFFTGGSPANPIFDLNLDSAFDDNDLADNCTPNTNTFITCIPVSKYLGDGVFSQPRLAIADGFITTLYTNHPDLPSGDITDGGPGIANGHFDYDIYYYQGGGGTVTVPTTNSETQSGLCADTAAVQNEFDQISNTFCTTSNGFSSGYEYMTDFTVGGSCGGSDTKTATICEKTSKVQKDLNKKSKMCKDKPDPKLPKGYEILTNFSTGDKCGKNKSDPNKQKYEQTVICRNKNVSQQNYHDITCNTVTTQSTVSGTDYFNAKHVHRYDDIFEVTGVNMLNPSLVDFDIKKAITDVTTEFKILVMNQYLNPAATLSVGGADYESVKTYGNLASETNPQTLLDGLPTYSRDNIGSFIYNLPLDAFAAKDWWVDGTIRAGLIPTQTGCVNKVNTDGTMVNDTGKNKGLIGPNGERFDGAFTLQLIKPDTPASALELNHDGNGGLADQERVKYGWRVKQSEFSNWVLAEYTSFWHHKSSGLCYGDTNWIPDPGPDTSPEKDNECSGPSPDKLCPPEPGSADPKDGVFASGQAIVDETVNVSGNTTTTTITYTGGATYVKTETQNTDGTIAVTQAYNGNIFGALSNTTVTIVLAGTSGTKGTFIDPSSGSPEEDLGGTATGRQAWREIVD